MEKRKEITTASNQIPSEWLADIFLHTEPKVCAGNPFTRSVWNEVGGCVVTAGAAGSQWLTLRAEPRLSESPSVADAVS